MFTTMRHAFMTTTSAVLLVSALAAPPAAFAAQHIWKSRTKWIGRIVQR